MKKPLLRIGMDDLDVIRKRRLQTSNYNVAANYESFSCEGKVMLVYEKKDTEFGTSKLEIKVSNRYNVNGLYSVVNGG